MAIEPRLADDIGQRAAEPLRHPLDLALHLLQIFIAARLDHDGNARRPAILAERLAQRLTPLADRDTGLRRRNARRHDVRAAHRRRAQLAQRICCRIRVALRPPRLQLGNLPAFRAMIRRHDRAVAARQRRDFRRLIPVDADHNLPPRLDLFQARTLALDQFLLHELDIVDRPARCIQLREHLTRLILQRLGLRGHHMRTVEQVFELQQIGLKGEDLLQAQRPLLVPWPRQAQRLVPRRQLQRAATRPLRQRDGKRLNQNAIDVVFRLLLGKAKRVHLHAIAEHQRARIRHAIALATDLFPEIHERAHLAHLGHEPHARVYEERDAREHRREILVGHLPASLHRVEHRARRRQRKRQFLLRRRARFLQVVRTDVQRIPLRRLGIAPRHHVPDKPHRGLRRKHIGAAREVFLDDVVLRRALQLPAIAALLVRQRDIQ